MRFVFFLLLFLFSVNGWSACAPYSQSAINQQTCRALLCVGQSPACPTVQNAVLNGDNSNECQLNTGSSDCRVVNNFTIICNYTKCDTKCEADSVACVNQGHQWSSANCQCLGDDGCSEFRSECEDMGGRFTGTVVSDNGLTCCRSSCNVCGGTAMKNLYNAKAKICCDNLMAPPDSAQTCQTVSMPTSGCGMVVSSYGDFSSGGWQCGDPSTSFEAAARYRDQCLNSSSSTANSSSSGANSSSSGASSSASGDCPECPILEEILATLIDQKGTVERIYECLTSRALCDFGGSDSLPSWVREKMEQIISYDSLTSIRAGSIDSVVRVIMESQKDLINSDSVTRETIKEGVDSIVHAISNGLGSDSLGEYIDRIANHIGTNSTMLSHHLDSILERIPGPILDSILANQKSMFDSFDSAFWNIGNGFEKIDNLTDSAVKYFQQGFRYDSIYNLKYSDSLGAIHEAIDGIASSVGYGFGYGDTASKNLRDDLENISGVLQGMSDSLNKGSYDTSTVFDSYLSGNDTAAVNFLTNLGSMASGALADSSYEGIFNGLSSSSSGTVDYSLPNSDSLQAVLQASVDSSYTALQGTLESYFDTLRDEIVLINFDSLIISPLGAKVPNTNTCPEDCFRINMSDAGGIFSGVTGLTWGVCNSISSLAGLNVLQFVRLLLRIVTAVSCIYIGMWFISGRKD